MLLTDREWLRFVTFGIVVGGALGASYTGALFLGGRGIPGAIVGGIGAAGVLAVLAHLAIRYVLDRASEPPEPDETAEDSEVAEA
jgi:hypothetical protein